jgi:hypothetical protein
MIAVFFCRVTLLSDSLNSFQPAAQAGTLFLFQMDNGYFDEAIIETLELLGCKYLIKGKEYPTLVSQVTDPPIYS